VRLARASLPRPIEPSGPMQTRDDTEVDRRRVRPHRSGRSVDDVGCRQDEHRVIFSREAGLGGLRLPRVSRLPGARDPSRAVTCHHTCVLTSFTSSQHAPMPSTLAGRASRRLGRPPMPSTLAGRASRRLGRRSRLLGFASLFSSGLVFPIQHALTSSPLSLRTIRFARFLSARTTR